MANLFTYGTTSLFNGEVISDDGLIRVPNNIIAGMIAICTDSAYYGVENVSSGMQARILAEYKDNIAFVVQNDQNVYTVYAAHAQKDENDFILTETNDNICIGVALARMFVTQKDIDDFSKFVSLQRKSKASTERAKEILIKIMTSISKVTFTNGATPYTARVDALTVENLSESVSSKTVKPMYFLPKGQAGKPISFVNKYMLEGAPGGKEFDREVIVKEWIDDLASAIQYSTKFNSPIRTVGIFGPAGNGKSMGCEILASMLGIGYEYITCNPTMEQFDLIGQIIPNTDDQDKE